MSRLGRRLVAMLLVVPAPAVAVAPELRPHVVRGIYGGVPQSILDSGQSLREFGLDAVWMGADSFTKERVALLRAQAAHVDVFSPMPYHARFGHPKDPEWISRQVAWLGRALGIEGRPGERHRIWPIVQISDRGEPVPVEQVPTVLDHGSRSPATGVMVFAWGGLRSQPEKIQAIGRVFRGFRRAK